MQWTIVHQKTWNPLNENRYPDETAARKDLSRLGETFRGMYHAVPFYENSVWQQIIMEGFKLGDLEGILLPQFSIDVYVPSDSKTDNIVIGFLIKGVPEAVFPFRNFCQYCRGVKHVDYGDSDTLPNTSIVYIEFERDVFELQDFFELVDQVCRLGGLKPDDLSVSFPNSNQSYPYSVRDIKRYFGSRDKDKNRLAQWKANNARTKQIQKELEDELDGGTVDKHLGVTPAETPTSTQAEINLAHRLKRLQKPTKPIGKKTEPTTQIDIPETIKASIVADAKRNRVNHQVQWKDFDTRWAQRLHVPLNRISSIRKTIYDRP